MLTPVWGAVAALDKLHAKHVLPGFTDRTAEEREIERQTTDITRVSGLVIRSAARWSRTWEMDSSRVNQVIHTSSEDL